MARLDLIDPQRDEDAGPAMSSVRESLIGTDEETLLHIAEAAAVVANVLELNAARHRAPRPESLRALASALRTGNLSETADDRRAA